MIAKEISNATEPVMDHKEPYIQVELGVGTTAAIHVVVPDGTRLDVAIERTDKNAAAFDYLTEKLKDGTNF